MSTKTIDVDYAGDSFCAVLDDSFKYNVAVRVLALRGPGDGWPVVELSGAELNVNELLGAWGYDASGLPLD